MRLKHYCWLSSQALTDALLAFIFSIVLFAPFIFSEKPWLLFAGDLHNLYFPQFVHGYYLAKSHIWYGVDLLTNNGASVYYLRPNIPAYYPPNLIIYKLFKLDGIGQFSTAFAWNLCFHSILAFYTIIRLSKLFLQIDIKYALFFAVAYVFTVAKINGLTPFYYMATLFPVIVYIALVSMQKKSWCFSFVAAFAYICAFLSGYLPLAIHGIALSLVVALAIRWSQDEGAIRIRIIDIVFAFAPVALAAAIVFPLYLAILGYHDLVPGVPSGVWAAHEFWYKLPDLLSLLSTGFLPETQAETPHVVVGLLPLFIIGLALSVKASSTLGKHSNGLALFALAVFGFHVILAAGKDTGLPDVFYYFVPGLGKMHLYGRYLITSSFLLFLGVTLLLKRLVETTGEINYLRLLLIVAVVICSIYVVSRFVFLTNIRVDLLVTELLFLAVFILLLRSKDTKQPVLWALVAVMLVKLGSFNSTYNYISPSSPGAYANALIFSQERQQAFLNYARQHAENRSLTKYADLTATIDKPDGVLLNFPWLVGSGPPVSNYMGYELHLSVDKDYLKRFPYFGKVDFLWLQNTGVDFFIVDEQAKKSHAAELERYADRSVPTLDLGFGVELIKANKIAPSEGASVNNGVFSVSSSDPSFTVGALEGNLSSYLAFNIRSDSPVSVKYLFFPNKMMKFVVNGVVLDDNNPTELVHFDLPPGQHRIEYVYKETKNKIFVHALRAYIYLLLLMAAWALTRAFFRGVKAWRDRRVRMS